MNFRFGILLLFFGTYFFCSQPEKKPTNDPYSLETLSFLEEVLLDVWESNDSRDSALARLRYVCRTRDTDDGFLCYTWGLLEFNRENYSESYTAFRKALEKNPNDTLYKNMLRLSAERSGNLKDLKNTSREGEVMAVFSEAIQTCQSGEAVDLSTFVFLAEAGILSKDHWKRGVLSVCVQSLTSQEKEILQKKIGSSSLSYKDRLLSDQMKTDPFSKVWDTSFYHKGDLGKEKEPSKSSLTEAWQKVKLAAKSGDESLGREGIRLFISEITLAKKKGNSFANLAMALERSAKLLLEQDPSYSKIKFLAKEL